VRREIMVQKVTHPETGIQTMAMRGIIPKTVVGITSRQIRNSRTLQWANLSKEQANRVVQAYGS
jgi:hypothetical protein